MTCIGQNVIDGVGGVISSAFSTVFGGIVTWLTGLITDAVSWMVKTLGTFWVSVGTPSVGDEQGTPSSTIGWMWDHLGWYTAALAVFAVLLGAGRMAVARRAEPGTDTLKAMVQFLVVNSLGIAVVAVGIEAADGFSSWIIDQSAPDGFAVSLGQLLGFAVVTGNAPIGLVLVVILGLLAVLASLIQVVLMVMRSAMLVLLMAVLPLAAAATNTEMGRQWFRKVLAWTLAFLLYKPVASIIYALAFRLLADSSITSGDELVSLITGITMMVMALLGLPALMRFLVPAVAATAGGAGAGATAAGAIATGALIVATGGVGAGAKGAAAVGSGSATGGGTATGSGGPTGGPSGGGPPGGDGGPDGGQTGGAPTGGEGAPPPGSDIPGQDSTSGGRGPARLVRAAVDAPRSSGGKDRGNGGVQDYPPAEPAGAQPASQRPVPAGGNR